MKTCTMYCKQLSCLSSHLNSCEQSIYLMSTIWTELTGVDLWVSLQCYLYESVGVELQLSVYIDDTVLVGEDVDTMFIATDHPWQINCKLFRVCNLSFPSLTQVVENLLPQYPHILCNDMIWLSLPDKIACNTQLRQNWVFPVPTKEKR